jgi:parvulin-like peptidyl-prolyl isomerase
MLGSRMCCALVALLTTGLILAGCGSGKTNSSQTATTSKHAATDSAERTAGSAASGGAVVARVADNQISEGALEHRMSIIAVERHLVHPDAQQASALRRQALSYLISSYWMIEGAREVSRGVSAQQADAKLALASRRLFKSVAAFQQSLKETGKTTTDARFELQAGQSSENLRAYILERAPHVTAAQVAARFSRNARRYEVPESRDLNIVRVGTQAEALKVRREIKNGRSFASIARGKPGQPVYSHDGHVEGLIPGAYAEPKLSDAIFAAKPRALSQPVAISLGIYVFEVKRTHPPRRRTLSEVHQKIEQELAPKLRTTAVDRFVSAWRNTWKSRTHCRPGFVVVNCSESSAPLTHAAEGPYALG